MHASQRVVGDLGIPGVKYGMDFNGYFGGPARLPLLPLTGVVPYIDPKMSSSFWRRVTESNHS